MEWLKKFVFNQVLSYVVNKEEAQKMMTTIKAFLAGKKTYIVAISAILGVVISWSNGSIGDAEALRSIIEAVLACTIRAGVAKAA